MNLFPKYQLSSFSILIIFLLLMIVGISLLPLLNVQLTPSRSLPGLSVSYRWPDASARVIEQEVTAKLEGLFSSVKGIKGVSSVSSKGSGRINLSFKKTVNLDAARFEVASLIRRAYGDLPEQVSFPELSMSTSGENSSPILTYTLNASESPFFIQKFAESHLVPKLSVIPGISGVKVYGSTPYEWEIRFNSELVQQLGIGSNEIAQSVSNYFRKDYLGQGTVSEVTQNAETISKVWKCPVERHIYILSDLTRGKEERIFTYENGKQVWWWSTVLIPTTNTIEGGRKKISIILFSNDGNGIRWNRMLKQLK